MARTGCDGFADVRRLLDAGTEVVVWNRTPGRSKALSGAKVAGTPEDAVRQAELVITMLADPAALHAVTDALKTGSTVIEMSTVGPAEVARLRSELPAEVILLDAPVLGSRAEAEAGTLTLLVGGPADAVKQWTELLSVLGDVDHVGPVGAGAKAKLVANNALLGVTALLGESIALADDLGLPRDVTWRTNDGGGVRPRRHAARHHDMCSAGVRRKPSPAGLELACRKLGVHPTEAIYVGDAEVDLLCATAAGAQPVLASWDTQKA